MIGDSFFYSRSHGEKGYSFVLVFEVEQNLVKRLAISF